MTQEKGPYEPMVSVPVWAIGVIVDAYCAGDTGVTPTTDKALDVITEVLQAALAPTDKARERA
jgi:hypothetical protein